MIYVLKSPTNTLSLFKVENNTDIVGNDYSEDPQSEGDPFRWASYGRESSKVGWTVCKLFKTKEEAEKYVPKYKDCNNKYCDYKFSAQTKALGILKES